MHSHFVFSEKPVKCGRRMKAILKYKMKTSSMSRNSSKVSNQNKEGMFFWPKFAQNWMFRSELQKSESEFLISFSKISRAPVFRQNGQFWLFWPTFAQKWTLMSELWRSKFGFWISTSKILCVPISRQNGQLWLSHPKFAQKRI